MNITEKKRWRTLHQATDTFGFFLLVLSAITLFFSQPSWALEPVVLEAEGKQYPAGLDLEYLKDPEGKLRLEDVISAPNTTQWIQSRWQVPDFNLTTAVYWFRIKTINRTPSFDRWVLEVGYPHLARITFYYPTADGTYRASKTGDAHPFNTRDIKVRTFVFKLHLPENAATVFYFRIDTNATIVFPVTIWSKDAFIEKTDREQYAFGLYYGIMLVMIFYNFIIFLAIRDKSYLFYVFYVICFAVFQLAINGLSIGYLWPDSPWWAQRAISFMGAAASFWFIWFTLSFLHTQKYTPWLHKILLASAGLETVLMVLSIIAPPAVSLAGIGIIASILPIAIFSAGVRVLRKGFIPARFFLLALTMLLIGIMFYGLKVLGIMPYTFITEYGIQIGSAIELVLLSLGLVYRINTERMEKYLAQKEAMKNAQLVREAQMAALEVQRQAAKTLQTEVDLKTRDLKSRTEELEQAYARLAELDRLKTNFFANISHELRTPLTLIIGPLELATSGTYGCYSSAQSHQNQLMLRNSRRLLGLINQLLDLSKLEAGKMKLQARPVNLVHYISMETAAFESLAKKKDIRFTLAAKVEALDVFIDPEKMETVLFNLISNAFKFTPAGGEISVTISAPFSVAEESQKPSCAFLIVDDEDRVLELLDNSLRAFGERKMASSAANARALLDSFQFKCIISDAQMPGEDGLSLLAHAAKVQPHCFRILNTGHAENEMLQRAVHLEHVQHIFYKPWNQERATAIIADVINREKTNDGPHEGVEIRIKDSGPGISERDLPYIFDRFHQIEGASGGDYQGTGIGLALVKELIELHHGEIRVESAVGVGTAFTIRLALGKGHLKAEELDSIPWEARRMTNRSAPRAEEALGTIEPREQTPLRPASQDAGGATTRPGRTAREKVLVVEDHPDMRSHIKDILDEHFDVDECENGQRGFELAKKVGPDLIVSDVMMPIMDGFELLRQVRNDPDLSAVPVMLLTAKAGQERKIEGLERGADDYLGKPFESRELLARAHNLIRLQQQERQLRILQGREMEKIKESLEDAQAVQKTLLPEKIGCENFSFCECYQAAEQLGGDWYGYHFDPDDSRLFVFIADVMGHGYPSALITGATAGALYSGLASIKKTDRQMEMAEALTYLVHSANEVILKTGARTNLMVTMSLVCIDGQSGHGAYLNAGHQHVLHISNGQPHVLLTPSHPLGTTHSLHVAVEPFQLRPNDYLFFFTDGLVENKGPSGKQLNSRVLVKCLTDHHELETIKDAILAEANIIWKGEKPQDDYSFLMARWKGPHSFD